MGYCKSDTVFKATMWWELLCNLLRAQGEGRYQQLRLSSVTSQPLCTVVGISPAATPDHHDVYGRIFSHVFTHLRIHEQYYLIHPTMFASVITMPSCCTIIHTAGVLLVG